MKRSTVTLALAAPLQTYAHEAPELVCEQLNYGDYGSRYLSVRLANRFQWTNWTRGKPEMPPCRQKEDADLDAKQDEFPEKKA